MITQDEKLANDCKVYDVLVVLRYLLDQVGYYGMPTNNNARCTAQATLEKYRDVIRRFE